MKELLSIVAFLIAFGSYAQKLDKLILADSEIPESYKKTNRMIYKSIQAATFYDQTDIYAGMLGKILNKEYQSFKSKKDSGTIFYYEYEGDFNGETFLEGLLWGGNKPTKSHPEEIFVKDNILIIWSLSKKSGLKSISKEKVKKLLE